MAGVVVAGHVCVDLIPALPRLAGGFSYDPGTLVEVGPVTVSTGGCVPNTGQALHRLGSRVRLVGRVGDDPFGGIVRRSLAAKGLDDGIRVAPGESTSYSIILSPPGEDRMFLHFAGANDSFGEDDLTDADLSGARIFHFGYPPLMRRMYEDGGENLAGLMARAKRDGLVTSLDMAYPDPATASGGADWTRILGRTLPEVDIFVPSLDELLPMLDPDRPPSNGGPEGVAEVAADHASRLGERLLGMGAGIVGIKCGERGFYLRTGPEDRLRATGLFPDAGVWSDLELWSPVFEVEVAGTAGAGDATGAGLLHALLLGEAPEDAVTAAVASGASSVEAADATSGVRSWEETRRRISDGWRRKTDPPGKGWSPLDETGIWMRRF
jgi:sugar/nucleoside kinase (ribokinase family)